MGNNGICRFSFQEYATGCHICDKTPEQGKNLSQKGKKKGYAVVEVYVFVNLWRDKTNKFKFLK